MRITASRLILCFYAISFHIMVKHVQCDWLIKCGDCKCKWNSGKKTADCKNITLAKIPQYLSSELQVLDLSLNRITIIDSEAFLKADLQNLHKLFMRNCSLEIIHPNGLEGLEILIELDFSNNVIKSLPKDCFVSLVKLRSLILNNNQIETLENGLFRNLKYLHKVELTDNRIATVGTDVFINLPFLSQIFLSSNRLTFLRKETFDKLKRLASLSLESNPWNCTCDLQPFRDFTLQRNLYTPPTSCHYPLQLRGMLWTDNQPEAFACKPKIIYPSRGASINTSKENVTLICRVHASPNTMIAWDYNKQIYSSSSSNYQARVNIQLLREENNISDNNNSNNRNSINVNNINDNNNNINNNNNNNNNNEFGRDIFISRLTIFGAEKSDEGIYTCVAENAGGKDEVQMNLLVQKHNHQSILLQNNLIIIICLMVLGLLSASIFLAMVTCCVYKRFKSINHGHHTNGGNDQHHLQHQKRNFNGLNVVNSVNDTYHHHHQRDDANYVEIKQTKVSSSAGNLSAVGSINNFTDLNDTRGYYYENSNQEAVTQQAQQLNHHQQHQQQKHHQFQELHNVQPNCSKLPERHKQENTSDSTLGVGGGGGSGDYQPDLLPYIPQSISFNSSSLYSYAVNQPTLYDNQPHQQQQTNEHLYTQNMMDGGGHQSAPFGRHHPYQQHQLQQFGATNKPHHRSALHLEDQIDDLRYGNNFRRNSSKYESEQHHQPSEQGHGQNPNEYLHYGIMGLPGIVTGETSLQTTGLPSSLVDNTNETATVTGLGTLTRRSGNSLGGAGLGIGFSGGSGTGGSSYEDQSSELDDLGRQPIVRTSPSLNFLSNYYQRRELL